VNLTSVTVSADIARAASKAPNIQSNNTSAASTTFQTEATNLLKQQPINAIQPPAQNQSQIQSQNQSQTEDSSKNDSVKVSSSIGRAASSGQLSRAEALAIYQKIASLL
jgi:hypothetical protein